MVCDMVWYDVGVETWRKGECFATSKLKREVLSTVRRCLSETVCWFDKTTAWQHRHLQRTRIAGFHPPLKKRETGARRNAPALHATSRLQDDPDAVEEPSDQHRPTTGVAPEQP